MKPPTDKQIRFAQKIHFQMQIPLPEEKTSQAYYIYIRDNIEKYNQIIRDEWYHYHQFMRKYRQLRRSKGSYMDEEQDAAWAASMDFGWM